MRLMAALAARSANGFESTPMAEQIGQGAGAPERLKTGFSARYRPVGTFQIVERWSATVPAPTLSEEPRPSITHARRPQVAAAAVQVSRAKSFTG
jgi:hypothetical protein